MAADIIGVDAGGTWIKAARFSTDLHEQQRTKVASGAVRGRAAYLTSIADAIGAVSTANLSLIGLSLPGTFTPDRKVIKYMANVQGFGVGSEPLHIRNVFAPLVGHDQVVADNDAKCAALGEWRRGSGEANRRCSLLHITWGTGIGTGMIIDGEPQFGWEGGHVPLAFNQPSDFSCNCGSNIDLEAFIATPRLVTRARAWAAAKRYPTTLQLNDIKDDREVPKLISTAAQAGDELAVQLLRQAVGWLAKGLQVMAVISYPDMVTIGGAMMDSDWLLTELRTAVATEAQGFVRAALRPQMIHRAQLGNDAGMIGAAVLAQGLAA